MSLHPLRGANNLPATIVGVSCDCKPHVIAQWFVLVLVGALPLMETFSATYLKYMNASVCSDNERHRVTMCYHNVHFVHSGTMDSIRTRLEGSSLVNSEKRVITSCEGRACLCFRPFIWVAYIIASHLYACRIFNTPRNNDSYVQVPAASKAGLTLSPGIPLLRVRTSEHYESLLTTPKLHIL